MMVNSSVLVNTKLRVLNFTTGLLTVQDILMNKRSDTGERIVKLLPTKEDSTITEDKITRIKGCATMWHENQAEMSEMLKSIFRMDEDYCAR